jgi:hypothetical protein
MMILAGLPGSLEKRVKSIFSTIAQFPEGWELSFMPSKHNNPEIYETDIAKILDFAKEHSESHIVGVSKTDGTIRKTVAGGIRRYFRFRWLKNEALNYISGDREKFALHISHIIEEEQVWLGGVKPRDAASALLLPQGIFACERRFEEMWQRSESFGDINNTRASAVEIENFSQRYFQSSGDAGRRWIDCNTLIYSHHGPRHASAPFPSSWKYSFNLENGFHYDVNHAEGRPFFISDASGISHKAAKGMHINLDPHGNVR